MQPRTLCENETLAQTVNKMVRKALFVLHDTSDRPISTSVTELSCHAEFYVTLL